MIESLSSLVVLLPFCLLFIAIYRKEADWRQVFLSASVIWGVLLAAITEILSVFHLINRPWLLGAWLLVSGAIALFLVLRHSPKNILSKVRLLFHSFSQTVAQTVRANPLLGFTLLSLSIILFLSGLVAIAAPPNNYDSMTYHMSRVMNWLQNQSVAHYPTHNLRQLDLAPWHSFAIMHLQELSGDDRFANLIQWSSMVGCLIGVSLIAKQLGANLSGQLLSTMVCVSIPMGLIQAVTTQNDYVVSYWLVCLAVNVLLILDRPCTSKIALGFGASLGLAILTKATAYIYAFPFCVIWIIILIQQSLNKQLPQKIWNLALFSFLPTILINLGHWWRNIQVFQTPLGVSGDGTRNKLFTLAAFFSNLLRNISFHLPVPVQSVNEFFEKCILFIHRHLLNLDPNDPRTTFGRKTFQIPPVTPLDQNLIYLSDGTSGSLLHFILVLAAIAIYILHRRSRNKKRTLYLVSLLVSLVLFNILLAWQPWGSRLQLPFFVLASAFIGSVFIDAFSRAAFAYLLVFVLTVSSSPYLLFSASRPLLQNQHFFLAPSSIFDVPHEERYFLLYPDLGNDYVQALDTVFANECHAIGLDGNAANAWEYLLWVIAQKSSSQPVRFRAVNVGNASNAIALDSDQNFMPCAVLILDKPKMRRRVLRVKDPSTGRQSPYRRTIATREVTVYMSQNFLKRE